MNRLSIARWVLSKLLGAYLVYLLLFWLFPRLQIDWANMIFYEVYGWLVGVISVASLISYVLLPPPKKIEEPKPVEVEEKQRESACLGGNGEKKTTFYHQQ